MTATATALTAAPVAMAAAHVNAKSRKNCRVVTLSLGFMTPHPFGYGAIGAGDSGAAVVKSWHAADQSWQKDGNAR
ncbi:MAG TPA: hypothetical protein VEL04_08945 [Burkholderiales bacterium]|nr:hypothetical protein [Burkholderiales bacterium]